MAKDADIVVKAILHFGSHGFAPFLGGFFAGVNVVELLADIVDGTADAGKFVFSGVRISRFSRNFYMEQQMFEQIHIQLIDIAFFYINVLFHSPITAQPFWSADVLGRKLYETFFLVPLAVIFPSSIIFCRILRVVEVETPSAFSISVRGWGA